MKRPGMTFIEILIVIAIVAILGGATAPFFSRFLLQTNFDSTVDKIVGTIRKSQEYAMDGKGGVVWGICLSGGSIRLYGGSCASPTISENFTVPSTVSVSGLLDTTFNLRGEPSAAINITISSNLESASVILNSAGGLTLN